MTCKVDHGAAGAIPASLCRSCRPELNATKEEHKAAEAADRNRVKAASRLAAKHREIDKLARELAKPKMLKARPGTVEHKTKMQHERRLAELRAKYVK